MNLCVTALRIATPGFLFAGSNILLQGVCQALGNGVYSLLISLLRMVIAVLPLALLLSRLPGAETWVWMAFPVLNLAARETPGPARPCGFSFFSLCRAFHIPGITMLPL